MNEELFVSTDPQLVDWEWLVEAVRRSYWGARLTREQILLAGMYSIIFGLYQRGEPARMIGFARVLSDMTIVSTVTDLFVDEVHRGNGYGKLIMEAVVAHPSVKPTICFLETKDARGFYAKFGFRLCDQDVMQRDPKP